MAIDHALPRSVFTVLNIPLRVVPSVVRMATETTAIRRSKRASSAYPMPSSSLENLFLCFPFFLLEPLNVRRMRTASERTQVNARK
jgi:hypothetical protein